MAQHHAAFEISDDTMLGRKPGLLDDDAYAVSRRTAAAAIQRLDRTLGRGLSRGL